MYICFMDVVLTQEQIERARLWYDEHFGHVMRLLESSVSNHPPCDEDKNHPNLWKPGTWTWYLSTYGL